MTRTAKDWILALRPWSFSTSAIPVLVTLAYIYYVGATEGLATPESDWVSGVLSLLMIMVLHAGGNVVSDYYDHVRRIDLPGGPNGVTWIYSGVFSPGEILHYGLALVAVGAMLGMAILCRTDMGALWIGILAIVLPLGYPWLKAHALGDIDILLCFAMLPAVGTSYVVTGSYHPETMLLSLPYGLLTLSILHAKNTRDRANDRRAGLCTVPLLFGWQASRWLYVAMQSLPYLLVPACMVWLLPVTSGTMALLAVFVSLPLAIRNIRAMMAAKAETSQDIATLDQMSAQGQLAFGLLYAAGFVVAGIIGM